jgi:hypothetical protein
VKLCQNFWRHFCYVPLTRNAVDGVAQHQHLSETVSKPSTLDPPAASSSKRISPFFNRLSPGPTARPLGIRNALIPVVYWVLSSVELLTKCFLRHDEFTSDYNSAQSLLPLPRRTRHFLSCRLTAHLEVAGKSSWSAQTMIPWNSRSIR